MLGVGMLTVLYDLEMQAYVPYFYNYTTSQMWKNLSNAKWCAWLIDEIVAYSRQIWWLTGTSELNDIHSFCFAWARELQRSFNCFLHLCIWVLM